MRKLRKELGLFAAVYFVFPMGLIFLILIFTPLMFFSDISAIRNSGFAGPDVGLSLIGISGFVIGISLLVPALRKMYTYFPWLFSFVKIFFVSMVILTLGLSILNYGYKIVSPTRHTIFFILMIVFVIVGRLAMSVYFKRKPVMIEREGITYETK